MTTAYIYQADCLRKKGRGREGSKNGTTGCPRGAVQSMHVNFPQSSQMATLVEFCMQHHDTEAQ